ncbi:hypothetical protein Goarm_003946, partial [Gossypium armourianum]|nr:hypothetical protein [Gossypium armourianum]
FSPVKTSGGGGGENSSFATTKQANKELAYTVRVDEKCDVYNFRVLTVEVSIGRHPGDLISYFSSLKSTSSSMSNDQLALLKDTINQRLSPPIGQSAKDLVSTLKIAVACLNGNPQLRPAMQQVS